MFHEGTRLADLSAHPVPANRIPASAVAVLMVGLALLIAPCSILAQRSAAGRARRPVICIHDCPDTPEGSTSADDLKNFDHLVAVQATEQQSAAFTSVVKDAQAASAQLQTLRDLLLKAPAASSPSDRAVSLDHAIEKARAGHQNFLASFSPAQKSGLKDITKKLEEADSDLDKEIKMLDQIVQGDKAASEHIANSTANLDKALASFQNGQLALGSEMSIILPSAGQELTLNLPPVTNSINIAGRPISFSASGIASRTSVADGHNLFRLKLVADFSDLQQSITAILRSQLERSPRCGERIEIQQATLIPQTPASLVVIHLHFERWICPPGPGRENPTELAFGDATIDVKLTPAVEPNSDLGLVSAIGRVDADDFLRQALLSGSLGTTLREQVSAVLLSAMQKGVGLKATLPPAAQDFATIQKAQFQDASVGQLSLVLDGQLQLSDEQENQFVTQLKQRLSAEQTSP
jgi:hypothetical protein